jgi:heme-degrading monooxygenase HmoA
MHIDPFFQMISNTPEPPYYAVIFTSERTEGDNGYSNMSDAMVDLASKQDGFLGMETARNEIGITVSYWRDLASIKKWRDHIDHSVARKKGREEWYTAFKVRIALVEHDYDFFKT